MKLFIAPHNDDETLFGAFTLLRERPHVIVCLRSFVQENRGMGITYRHRESETAAAMEILGCTWEQWEFPDTAPAWHEMAHKLADCGPSEVWFPKSEIDGHPHHNHIGDICGTLWPHGTRYLTYTSHGKSIGNKVEYAPQWISLKMKALACYRSQILEPSCAEHFIRDQFEYVA